MEFVRRPGDSFRFFKCFLPQHEAFGESEVKIDIAVPVRAFPSVLNRLCRDWATSGPSVDFNMMSFLTGLSVFYGNLDLTIGEFTPPFYLMHGRCSIRRIPLHPQSHFYR